MHSIFQEGYVSHAYKVTAKMAADIHTKSFRDSVSWTHACPLINIFPPALIGSQEIMDLMRPTHAQSADEKGHQHYSFKGEVPCFPYTETTVLPQVLYRAGLSALPPGRYLRSTWILREGQWHQMEDRARMPDTPAKFDRYVERAVFQFHPVRGQLRSAAVSEASCSLTLTTSWPALCARPACQMAVAGCRAIARHPWEVPGLHTTSSFQRSSLFSTNSVCR